QSTPTTVVPAQAGTQQFPTIVVPAQAGTQQSPTIGRPGAGRDPAVPPSSSWRTPRPSGFPTTSSSRHTPGPVVARLADRSGSGESTVCRVATFAGATCTWATAGPRPSPGRRFGARFGAYGSVFASRAATGAGTPSTRCPSASARP